MNNNSSLRASRLVRWGVALALTLVAFTATAQTAKRKHTTHTDTTSHLYLKYLGLLDDLKNR